MSQPTYIASCSFGKDSIATILLALEHDEPLDRVVFSEVMFDHARNISGEIPEHIGWIYDTAIPKLHDMGIHVDVVRAERDYCYFFANAVGAGFVDDVQKGYPTEAAAILAALLDARKSAERELANCSGRSRSNLDNEDDEDGFIKDSTLAPYIRNIIKQIDDQRRATAFKQLTLF